MPKYKIKISAEAEIEAPNVAKAASTAKNSLRLIGNLIGSQRDSHDKNMWCKKVKVTEFTISNPRRVKND